ncbi:MAG: FIST N-terminal domain-containing protein [Limnothrix sp.]
MYLFAAIDFDHALILQEITKAFPSIELIGGTTDGEISSLLEFQQDSLTLMVFCSDTITISAGIGQKVSEDVAIAAKNAVEQAIAAHNEPVKLCISIPESLTVGGRFDFRCTQSDVGRRRPDFWGTHRRSMANETDLSIFQVR